MRKGKVSFLRTRRQRARPVLSPTRTCYEAPIPRMRKIALAMNMCSIPSYKNEKWPLRGPRLHNAAEASSIDVECTQRDREIRGRVLGASTRVYNPPYIL